MELNDPDEYRRQAKRLRERAADEATETMRQQMLKMAAGYEQLAECMERVRRKPERPN